MGFSRKKRDPITEKAQALNEQIASLEAQIKELSTATEAPTPRFRSSAVPRNYAGPMEKSHREPQPSEHFEEVDHTPLQSAEPRVKSDHFNDMGVRKYDLLAAWQRFKDHFKPPPASNPKLVSYLAAGSIQGLRPMRYEKRVARNRFVLLVMVLLLMLWGILAVVFRHS